MVSTGYFEIAVCLYSLISYNHSKEKEIGRKKSKISGKKNSFSLSLDGSKSKSI
jgi:hypothetical protein